ncbi:MAG: ATP-dependent DNA helicase RecG [Thermoanaerobacteraceae bacterium]|uniref:ATP-dependent DNA helicase RecG n=1 Tax=Thermanaeromonas sp. C210 TaxID=2731925 RepID=UPI00155BFD3E|nr:ATP-dependent DNA helicase RecG [Thermanaeromonas sp. C210]MBE3580747.1 ATP-dependent DNA helicase RecG [Thermoanaerobacteraceae bacterium]GFN23998.1 ATP-dependent DNA helicase RecG [Thermanaeromonas sp. C210]
MDRPVADLKYVGPQRRARLDRLGIRTVKDLIYHFPRRYEDRRRLSTLDGLVPGSRVTVLVTIVGWEEKSVRPRLTLMRAEVEGEGGRGYAVWYNQAYIKRRLPPGSRVLLTGKVSVRSLLPEIQVDDYELLEGEYTGLNTGYLVPFYPSSAGLTQRWHRLVTYQALAEYLPHIKETLPLEWRQQYRLVPLAKALRDIHFPSEEKALHQARRRLIYEELLIWELALAMHRRRTAGSEGGIAHSRDNTLVNKFLKGLPFSLTRAQERVLEEIFTDMEAPRPMARLLQGDVGSGKTVVAAAALVKAASGGWQGALMAPTEVLAEQHFLNFRRLLGSLGLSVALLTGSTNRREKDRVIAGLETGQISVVVGTHALIQESVKFKSLGLAVIDEQHRFGVRQRAQLPAKGRTPDLLVMTATPIPRTLALVAYGDLDVSLIDELPPGRKPVATYVLTGSQRRQAYRLVAKEVQAGRQAYIICPLIDESETQEAAAAAARARELQERVFPAFKVGLIHGRLRPAEKEEVMERFRQGDIQILVGTTVIEVGVDVPNATVIVIEGAERYGLAQLHQLRGRVARSSHQAYCLLITENNLGGTGRRLKVLVDNSDGFAIAEADLRLRGPGEFFGTRQHGWPEFRLAEFPRDLAVLEQARKDAHFLILSGYLDRPEYAELKALAEEKLAAWEV